MARRPSTSTTRPTSVGRSGGRLRVRSRLLLLLAVPLIALFGVTSFQVSRAVADTREADRLNVNAAVGLAAYDLVDALQSERAVLAAGGEVTPAQRDAVTAATAELRTTAGSAGGTLPALAARAVDRTEAAGVLARAGIGGVVAVDAYTPAVEAALGVARAGFDPGAAVDDRAAANTTVFLAAAQEDAALERDLVSAMTVDPDLINLRFQQVAALAAQQQTLVREAADALDGSGSGDVLARQVGRLGDSLTTAGLNRQRIFSEGVTEVTVAGWLDNAEARITDLRSFRDEAAGLAVAAVADLASSAREVLLLSALALAATVLVTGLLVRNATRSIARPLQGLAAQAEQVALSRLPDAVRHQQRGDEQVGLPTVRASGAAEVEEVAAAFNDVQETALRLAGEQAAMRRNLADALTNLGRRNQALLGRQLDFISDLEQRETDPAFLDHLFRLDHLASRMRRNAESLLVLAGSETPRRRRRPAPVVEVVRSAMGEVENFERVRLGDLGKAGVVGPAVIDLAHLLAELIENGLNFSPPDSTVEVEGRSLGQGGYQLAVVDHGVGLADVELRAANERLAGLADGGAMPTRYLGQYVVARLAEKIGAQVRLQPSVGGKGVTAVVTLPDSAMSGGTDRSSVARPLPGSRAAQEQGGHVAPGAGLASVDHQPTPVVDPAADPFAEPVPATFEPVAPAAAADAGSVTFEPLSFDGPAFDGQPVERRPFDIEATCPSVAAEDPLFRPPPPPPTSVPSQDWQPVGRLGDADGPDAGIDAAPVAPAEATEWFHHPSTGTAPDADGTAWGAEVTSFGDAGDTWLPAAAEPVERVDDLIAPFGGTDPTADGLGTDRSGGLQRRVPGASLSTSPLGDTAPLPTPTGQRSADEVRSMLASLQSGRHRGLAGDDPADTTDRREADGDH